MFNSESLPVVVILVVMVFSATCLGAPNDRGAIAHHEEETQTISNRKYQVSEVQHERRENKIVRYDVTQTETGSKFVYELEDGQFREEEIFVLNKGTKDEEIAVIGSYAFWGTDNFLYVTRYTADRNGYRAKTTQSHRDGFSTKTTIDEIAGDEPNKESEGVNNL